jgi:hypothetical protein
VVKKARRVNASFVRLRKKLRHQSEGFAISRGLMSNTSWPTRERTVSGSSTHGMRTAVSKVLQAAVDWNLLEQNPARGIHIGDRAPKTERLYLNPKEVGRFLAIRISKQLSMSTRTQFLKRNGVRSTKSLRFCSLMFTRLQPIQKIRRSTD